MNNFHYRRKSKIKIPFLIVLTIAVAGMVYIYMSSNFERIPPKIQVEEKIYWNLKKSIPIKIFDNSGIGSYKVSLVQKDKEILLEQKSEIKDSTKEVPLELTYVKSRMLSPGIKTVLKIEATDRSLWNFLAGNKTQKEIDVVIDEKRPIVNIISKSYAFRKGGSALVVFEAKDDYLSELYIENSTGRQFGVSKFLKDGFYIALVANDLRDKNFKMYVHAKDRAGNLTSVFIPFYYSSRSYRNSKITLSDKFLDGKVEQLYYETNYGSGVNGEDVDRLEKFRYINETLRDANYDFIAKYATEVPRDTVKRFDIKTFVPLINSAKVGSFGDHRFYQYKGHNVSESYHMGIDFASIKNDKIKISNRGQVKFAGNNGIYGNMAIIGHGLGLYTVYAHCSNLFVSDGKYVEEGEIIGETGTTGLALGDHLHFGVFVQGLEARPEEWLDKSWIKANIADVIDDAKKIIGES